MTDSVESPEYKLEIGNKSILLDYKRFMLLKGIKNMVPSPKPQRNRHSIQNSP